MVTVRSDLVHLNCVSNPESRHYERGVEDTVIGYRFNVKSGSTSSDTERVRSRGPRRRERRELGVGVTVTRDPNTPETTPVPTFYRGIQSTNPKLFTYLGSYSREGPCHGNVLENRTRLQFKCWTFLTPREDTDSNVLTCQPYT